MKSATLGALLAERAAKRPVALATNLTDGEERLLYPDKLDGEPDADLAEAVRKAFHSDRSGPVETAAGTVFLHVFNPPLRLIVIGAVHITQPLIRMAALAGYEVSVIDPRRSFATGERFPGVTLMDEWPDDGLEALALDARTAVVTLTHDPKLDDPALEVALRSGVFYIGSLGSRRTHAARLERLTQAGFDKTALARIHGPVGLSIGAKSPAEIAISIMAQITEALRQTA
ncbi:MAG TPA: XdhC family protein [Alphaproteobacteria bacterium]|jgi:xanthine dehydrogenase accessory factor|nr:XdhC family protein [Alphaproteobacteria bacterium]MDP6269597.1 XdhC family protein [Alphaproteobacteria bacterium]MDP7428406.1 XdhC family protein [Alphaproteobacteria bacterium]HJM48920.1 XdhC family protein [Alphaproteobacteria bacterium]